MWKSVAGLTEMPLSDHYWFGEFTKFTPALNSHGLLLEKKYATVGLYAEFLF